MRSLLNPKWLIVINTLPIILLFLLLYGEYSIINTLLELESKVLWKNFGFTLILLACLNFLYACFLIFKRKKVSFIYGIFALLIYTSYLYIYGNHINDIFPWSIPRWMTSEGISLYVGTFLMPTLAYSLFITVVEFTRNKEVKAWKNFLVALFIPIFWYIFSQVILPLWQPLGGNFGTHVLIIFIIIGTLLFLFFLIRGIYILATKKGDFLSQYQLFWKIPIAVIFPLLGLAINNGHIFDRYAVGEGIFGNFSNYWFYILAVVNGIVICLPDFKNKYQRLILFLARALTFSYTFYFFLVFLPFLPLSVLAIIVIGVGFLMLTPLVLFIIHASQLAKDFSYLKDFFSVKSIYILSIICFLILPLSIHFSYKKDKEVLNESLNYLYSTDYTKEYKIDRTSLRKTLNTIKFHKKRNWGLGLGSEIPYLTSYFNWLVLDNLTLSNDKIQTIEEIFFDVRNLTPNISEGVRNENVTISDIKSKSTYDENQKAWISWIDLEITNNQNRAFAEYSTSIDLPIGTWISDYYLYLGDRKEMGILAEKKSAKWVFSQIRNENKDPGILYYLTGSKVAFKVFPFAEKEVRKTGIQFIHKEPIVINIDGNNVSLGDKKEGINTSFENEEIIYISKQEKQQLPNVKRTPYYHFMIDISKGKSLRKENYVQRIKNLMAKNLINPTNAKVSFVNTFSKTVSYNQWSETFEKQPFNGGFYLERAIKKSLVASYQNQKNEFPVFVVVTDSIQNAIIKNNFSNLSFTYPESGLFYSLDDKSDLIAHSLNQNPKHKVKDSVKTTFDFEVLKYNKNGTTVFLANNDEPSIALKKAVFSINEDDIKQKEWETGLLLQGKYYSQLLHPENSNTDWLKILKHSFMSKIMTPYTSYLVVENEAQKAILKKKQEQVLSGNKNLDIGDDTQRMSEPSLYILLFILLMIVWFKNKSKLRTNEISP